MSDNILKFEPLTRIAERIRAAYKRTQQGRWEWIEGTLELAAALADGRARYSSNQEFAHWLVDMELDDIGHQDRAALIAMAANLALARSILEDSQRSSWQLIWDHEMQMRFTNASKKVDLSENAQTVGAVAPEQTSPQTDAPKTETSISLPRKRLDARHSFYGLSRADEVAALYLNKAIIPKIADALGRKGMKHRIWQLILTAMDNGFLVPNSVSPKEANIGVLFPSAPHRFRSQYSLLKSADVAVIETDIMPAALANRHAIVSIPQDIEETIAAHMRQLRNAITAQRQIIKLEAARAVMKAKETDVVVFGRRFWPIIDLDHPDLAYDYETLRHAVWTFRELHQVSRLGSDSSPKSCAVRIRHVIKFLTGYIDKKIMRLLHDMSRALQETPDGEERLPDMPNMDRPYE